ncbi:hypothetical protein BDW59DRAFT_165223 [Aspergillus cavernicola]|uniref:MARVEL domain-containing protein n=1 Tax=Aspergillus cavernicola TaxID=176166 RepID=A0ABR4HUA9_9EURO
MFQILNIRTEDIPRTKFRLHIAIGVLIAVTFILSIARAVDNGTPRGRLNTWGIIVCVKSSVFMAYQIVTGHIEKMKRWGNTRVNVVLNVIDTVFWSALFVFSIMGAMAARSTSSKALAAIVIIVALILCPLAAFLSFMCIRERRYFKQHGVLPGQAPKYASGAV